MFPPPIDDAELLPLLPEELRRLLVTENGSFRFAGGLHVRGVCLAPEWHSLRYSWLGAGSLSVLYPALAADDLPFAQDCVGDQFVLREGTVHRLYAEDGTLESLRISLHQFLQACAADPTDFLLSQPLLQLQAEGGALVPGQLILAYPPFCTKQSGRGVKLSACPAQEVIAFHARLSAGIANLPEGAPFEIKVVP